MKGERVTMRMLARIAGVKDNTVAKYVKELLPLALELPESSIDLSGRLRMLD
jgi:hypothetical protein